MLGLVLMHRAPPFMRWWESRVPPDWGGQTAAALGCGAFRLRPRRLLHAADQQPRCGVGRRPGGRLGVERAP